MAPPSLNSSPAQEPPETNDPPTPASGILAKDASNQKWMPSTVLNQLPSTSRPHSRSSSPVPFFHILERLKTTKREGWRRFNIVRGESISDHMYRMSIMALFPPPSLQGRIDVSKCMKIALVHDMAELLVGDITPVDGVDKSEKSRRESITMDYLCEELLGNVNGGVEGRELREAWQEYEDGQTLDSKFVHDVDKVELILQMVEYERSQGGEVDLGEFTWVANRVVLPEVQEWCKEVLAGRAQYWRGLGKTPSNFADSAKPVALQDQHCAHSEVNGKH